MVDEFDNCKWCDKDGGCVIFECICDSYCGVKTK